MRGILIERMPCPMLEIMGGLNDYYPINPSYYGIGLAGAQIIVADSSHWGLALSRRIIATLLPRTLDWLDRNV